MAFPLLAAALPALGTIVGGILGKKSADQAADQAGDAARMNDMTQREFAQQGIRWRVEDAKAAGIHPLAALGAQTTSYAPSHVGQSADMSMANMASGLGQDLGRAISSTRTADERQLANIQLASAKTDLDGKMLDNQIKASQLRQLQQVGPAFPGSSSFIPGQGNSGPGVIDKPQERVASAKGAPYSQAGAHNSLGWETTPTGVVPVPSKDSKEAIEDNMFHEARHFFRNNVMPNFGVDDAKPPRSGLPKGASDWSWSYTRQEWQPLYDRKVRGGSERRRTNF